MYPKKKSQLWLIHGKWYDLSDYMKRHPGGEEIIRQTRGQGDVSVLFETYHAFSELQTIASILPKYEVDKSHILKEDDEEESHSEKETEQIQEPETEEEWENWEEWEDWGNPESETPEEDEHFEELELEPELETENDYEQDGDDEEGEGEEEEEDEDMQLTQEDFEHQFHKMVQSHSVNMLESEEEEEEERRRGRIEETRNRAEKWGEFDFTSYRQLVKRVKESFPDRKSVKAPMEWYMITGYMVCVFLYTFTNAMFLSNQSLQTILLYPLPFEWMSMEEQIAHLRTLFTVLASVSWISIGFHLMHDGSHYAISIKPWVNQAITKSWNALNLWNSKIWFYHHIVHHHSFTGLLHRDPDVTQYHPFGIKKREDDSESLVQWSYQYQDKCIPFLLFFFPGYSIAQSITYQVAAYQRKIYHIPLPDEEQVPEFYDPFDLLGMFFTLACFQIILMKGHLFYLLMFLMCNNIIYAVNVVFDHDCFENVVSNRYEGKDWLKLQIRHSGNFMNKDMLWTRIFGSINYQIEHHLFPNMSNYHYPYIQPIVKEFCREHQIPYTHHATLGEAWKSFIKMLRYNMFTPLLHYQEDKTFRTTNNTDI